MRPDEEIQYRLRRLHDWAERRPHGLVVPGLPTAEARPPDRRRLRAPTFAAAAAVVLVALGGHSLGLTPSGGEAVGRPEEIGAAPARSTASSPATSPAPAAASASRTSVPGRRLSSAGSAPTPSITRTVASRRDPLPSRAGTVRPSVGATPAVGTVIGLEPLALPGSLVRHENLDLRVAQTPSPGSAADAAASSFLVRPGLTSPGGLSLESVDLPGHFVSVADDRAVLRRHDGTAAFEGNATFLATASPTGQGMSFAPFAQRSSPLSTIGDALYARPSGGNQVRHGAAFMVRQGLFTQPVNVVRTSGQILGPSGRCVDIWGADKGIDGAPAGLWDCQTGATDQLFSHELDFSLRTLGRCLDVVGPDTGEIGAEVILWSCQDDARDQQWVPAPDGTLRSEASGLCLRAADGGTTNGGRLELNVCTGSEDQQFRLT